MNKMKILESINIHKTFHNDAGETTVLRGVDFCVEAGDFVSIVGPSGAGKSTLLHILGGLDRPNEGMVVLDGQDVYALSDEQRSRLRCQKIGFVFQFYHLLPEFTVLENVALPGMIAQNKNNIAAFEEKARELLTRFGLAARVKHRPHQLSGGEQQRVAIARALFNDPKVIFCDEPTGNLDSGIGREIMELLRDLNRRNGQTLVVVTHDEHFASMARIAWHMRDGKMAQLAKNV